MLIGCAAGKQEQNTVGLEESFTLVVNNSAVLKDGKTSFSLMPIEVQDSRCPKNARCITAGAARVQLQTEAATDTLSLCLGGDCRGLNSNSVELEYNNERYTIVLEEVSPYPEAGGGKEPKKMTFKIKRVTG